MKKVILVNAIVTILAFILDIYGVFDLSFKVALISLFMGIIDVITFIWIREELKEWIKRRKETKERRRLG